MILLRPLVAGLLLLSCSAFAQRAPLVPEDVMGVETCRECHEEMVLEWEGTAHARGLSDPVSTESAAVIAEILGMRPADIPRSASCVRCHFTEEVLSGVPQVTSGVGCESCHGAAADWIDVHNSRGASRGQRVDESLRLGMAHPGSILAVSKACYECHIVDDEQLVNGTGHPALSEGFEILSWYSGEVNHNFLVDRGSRLKGHADQLQPIPQTRKRLLFLNGRLLQLGYLLRALSDARDAPVDRDGNFIRLRDGSYTYGVQIAREIKRVEASMRDVTKRVKISEYVEALALLRSIRFETGGRPDMRDAAETLFRLSESFCRNHDGSEFSAIDDLIEELKPRYSDGR